MKANSCLKKGGGPQCGPWYRELCSPLLRILARKTNGDDSDGRSWETLVRFFGCSWFHRIWVIQEVVMARAVTIYFGDSKSTGQTSHWSAQWADPM